MTGLTAGVGFVQDVVMVPVNAMIISPSIAVEIATWFLNNTDFLLSVKV
jgi:hypothetical protein